MRKAEEEEKSRDTTGQQHRAMEGNENNRRTVEPSGECPALPPQKGNKMENKTEHIDNPRV